MANTKETKTTGKKLTDREIIIATGKAVNRTVKAIQNSRTDENFCYQCGGEIGDAFGFCADCSNEENQQFDSSRTEDSSCPSCGEFDGDHIDDCPVC